MSASLKMVTLYVNININKFFKRKESNLLIHCADLKFLFLYFLFLKEKKTRRKRKRRDLDLELGKTKNKTN